MPFDRDILSKVKRLASQKADAMTADHLFTSGQFISYAQSVINSITSRCKFKVKLHVYHGDLDGDTAYTDKRVVTVNTHHQRIYYFDSLLNKFLSQMGGILHECAHILYMNFEIWNNQIASVCAGTFPELPASESKEEQEALDEMVETLQDELKRPILAEMYKYIYNALQDGHDEDRIMAESVPFVSQCILIRREAKIAEFPSAEEMAADQNLTKMEMMFSLILESALFEDIYMEDPAAAMALEPMQRIRAMMPSIQNGKYTDDAHARGEMTVKLMAFLWPYIRDELDRQSSQVSNPPGAQLDPQVIQAVMQLLSQAAQQGGTQVPQNTKSSAIAKARQRAAQKNAGNAQQLTQQASPGTTENDAGENALAGIVNSISQEEAEEEVQQAVSADANISIQAVSQNSTHRGIPVFFHSMDQVTGDDIAVYNSAMNELSAYSKRLQRQMQDALRGLQEGHTARHKSFGNRFEAKDAYRPDQRYFTVKKLPLDLPEMAISILVDHSGSMDGERLSASMRGAILLYDFATKLGIPVEVAGHNTHDYGRGVNYYLYTDFRQVSPNEKYRLAKMESNGCNRDGAAIEIAAHRLSLRMEDVKMLIIISDGQPNDNGYSGEAAADDIRSIVTRYRRQGVETIAAAIGDDKENIRDIYGAGAFLDIDDLDRLPKALAGLVKKRILN